MTYAFTPGLRYRMPTHFGPSTGPRQRPGGGRFDYSEFETLTVAVTSAAPAAKLERLLPERFALEEAQATVAFSYYDRVPWLAGRGYNIFGVTVPVRFEGAVDRVAGELMLVLWENMADPVITGREELGIAKIFCDIPAPRRHAGELVARASWDGCEFARLVYRADADPGAGTGADDDVAATEPAATGSTGPRPWLHLKYTPSTERVDQPDASYVTMTPPAEPGVSSLVEASRGRAELTFSAVTWEQLPTQYMIVNALHELGLTGGAARLTRSVGAEDVSRQSVLR